MIAEVHLGNVDYAILAALFIFSLLIGLYFAWIDRKKDTDEFLMAGKSMSALPVMMSLVASFLSSITVLGWPSEVYYKGIGIWVTIFVCFLEVTFTAELVLPIFYRLNLTSVNKYLKERFGSKILQITVSIVTCISMFPWLGVALYGPSLALGAVTGLSVTSSVLLCGIICTIYTAIGGLKAVIWTDVMQYLLMILGIIVVIVKGISDVGSLSEVWHRAELGGRTRFFDTHFDPYNSYNQWTLVLGTLCVWTGGLSTSQIMIQRTLSMRNLKEAKKVVYLALPGFQVMNVLVTLMGLVTFAYFFKCDPLKLGKIEATDQIVPYFVATIFGDQFPGMLGLFIACVFSSTLSTLSSAFNAIAALVWDDILKKCFPTSSTWVQVTITKLVAAVAGILCIGVAFMAARAGTLLEASYLLSGSPLGPTFGVFIMGMFLPFTNSKGALTGYFMGQITCIWIVIGGILSTRPKRELQVSMEACPANLTTFKMLNSSLPFDQLYDYFPPPYEPIGLDRVYHLSHFLIPFVGLIVTLIVGMIISILTGGNKRRCVNPDLLVPWAQKWCHVPDHRVMRNGNEKVNKNIWNKKQENSPLDPNFYHEMS